MVRPSAVTNRSVPSRFAHDPVPTFVLNTLLRPQRANTGDAPRFTPEAEALLEKLRALGITEETVPAP